MATCTIEAYSASACWGHPCQSDIERKAMQMRLLILELAALGGPDFTDDLDGLSIEVAQIRPLLDDQIKSALTGVFAENAVAAGAVVGTPEDIREQATCYVCLQDNMDAYLLHLQCLLGGHATQ